MKYFTIGPVQMSKIVASRGGEQALYFRDYDFAEQVIKAQNELLAIADAPKESKIAILSSCGTAGMEAAVINFTRPHDPVIVVNGGSFGQRFVDIATFYSRKVDEYIVQPGQPIDLVEFEAAVKKNPKAVFINGHETSTGQKYDLDVIGAICKKYNVLLICDAVGFFLCDPLNMTRQNVNVIIFSSNKGLALSPGASFIIADGIAIENMKCTESYHLNLGRYFDSSHRGQPPFTSTISVLMQLFARLEQIRELGGVEEVIAHTEKLAVLFRKKMIENEFKLFPTNPSNAITAIVLEKGTSEDLYNYLKRNYGFLINKTAWGLGMDIPRISHVGNLSINDFHHLAQAFKEYKNVH